MAQKQKRKKLRRVNAWVVMILSLLAVAVVGFLAWTQLNVYEEGVLGVYANQQDGYVQLVLDQINLKENRESQEMIEDILQTLDASSSHYWTLSEQNSIIFVKDVLETNRYKGLTTESYYATNTAEAFIASLKDNKVTHARIEMDGKRYVASGVRFVYNGNNYNLCLLTGAETILDQNEYLSAKINLSLLVIIALSLFVIGAMALTILAEKWYRKYATSERENAALMSKVEKLNVEMAKDLLVHPQYAAFHVNALERLLEKLEIKPIWPLDMLFIRCPEGEERAKFFSAAQLAFNERTIRVILDDTYILLLELISEEVDDQTKRRKIADLGGTLVSRRYLQKKPMKYLTEVFANMYKEVIAHE